MANTVIINGRRVPVADAVRGSELLENAPNIPGRRMVIRNGMDAETIDPGKTYNPGNLVDKKGNPVKIDSIPDRTKGYEALHQSGSEKVIFFLDYANINRAACDNNIRIDYGHLQSYISEGRFLVDSFAYFPIDPRNEHGTDNYKEKLWLKGYLVKEKTGTIAGNTYKCNMDIEMTMDILKTAYHAKPDIIVLASGDSDFIPLITELRSMGIRTEVAAFSSCASRDIVLKSSGFIDLDTYYRQYIKEVEELLSENEDILLENDAEPESVVEKIEPHDNITGEKK